MRPSLPLASRRSRVLGGRRGACGLGHRLFRFDFGGGRRRRGCATDPWLSCLEQLHGEKSAEQNARCRRSAGNDQRMVLDCFTRMQKSFRRSHVLPLTFPDPSLGSAGQRQRASCCSSGTRLSDEPTIMVHTSRERPRRLKRVARSPERPIRFFRFFSLQAEGQFSLSPSQSGDLPALSRRGARG